MKRNLEYDKALDTPFHTHDLGKVTLRTYFAKLLAQLISEGEMFSGKRPFGNSGWEYDLYEPLIRTGLVKGTIDDEAGEMDIDSKNRAKAGKLLEKLAHYALAATLQESA